MTTSTSITLTTAIEDIPGAGIGPVRAAAFRRIGIRCAADLLLHLPSRYETTHGRRSIAEASELIGQSHGSQANLSVQGEIAAVRPHPGRRSRTEATLMDESGTVLLTWFNAPWMKDKLHPGMRILATGKTKRHGEYLQLINPQWTDITNSDPEAASDGPGLQPVYPAGEKLSSRDVARAVAAVLDDVLAQLDDHLPADYRERRALPELAEAYRMVHRPADDDAYAAGRRRLAFDELLLLQLAVMIKRRHRRTDLTAPQLKHDAKIGRRIAARLPFKLTRGQKAVVADIVEDVTKTMPMNRLLQGDVGSGKTAVAVYAMLMAVAQEHQAAMMAPTELLAEQHHETITAMLAESQVRIELLTGSLKAAERRAIHKSLESGEIDVVIGTHALLTETVRFRNLAVAVIDEQHRFGVHQRAAVRTRSNDESVVPHTLVMTATPIPRTLSLSVFGDLDISTIRGMPPGRQPVITRLVSSQQSETVYEFVARRIDAGEQAYVVVPAVEASEAGLKSVEKHVQHLRDGALRNAQVEAVHGRLDRAARENIMSRFRAGEIDVLVATTVIEVGVDVPNACIMVIEQADRFGLAQLHQLRGRVGRGTNQSLCTLIADPTTDDARARLQTIVDTDDGFKIAEKDLELRGPGELFGARQSGIAPFRVAELPKDLKLLQMARRDAEQWVETNPNLGGSRDAILRKRLIKAHGKAFGLGDVA